MKITPGKTVAVVAAFMALTALVCAGASGCSGSKAKDKAAAKTVSKGDDPQILSILSAMSSGKYEEVIRLSKDILKQSPGGSTAPAVLYLQSYAVAYGRSDFSGAIAPLKKLMDTDPKGPYGADAQRLLADCQYWLGRYRPAVSEYKKLEQDYGSKGYAVYAQTQIGNCQFLEGKVGDALATYRLVVEKSPKDPLALSAQLMIGNIYLKVQNLDQAKAEFLKVLSMTNNQELLKVVHNTIERLEKSEPNRKRTSASSPAGI